MPKTHEMKPNANMICRRAVIPYAHAYSLANREDVEYLVRTGPSPQPSLLLANFTLHRVTVTATSSGRRPHRTVEGNKQLVFAYLHSSKVNSFTPPLLWNGMELTLCTQSGVESRNRWYCPSQRCQRRYRRWVCPWRSRCRGGPGV